MREKPILFSTGMVRAILDGRKTMTRRIAKMQSTTREPVYKRPDGLYVFTQCGGVAVSNPFRCPYGQVGDALWVRETYSDYQGAFIYKADNKWNRIIESDPENKWRPSIFMPKEACRLKLRITNIRAERLNDISRGDAMQEGCPFPNVARENDPVNWFIYLWEKINGSGSWADNPWVWVIEFEIMETPS